MRPGFLHGVIAAGALALGTAAIDAALTPLVGAGAVLRLAIPATGLAYVLYLFGASGQRVGRVTAVALWSAVAAIAWWLAPPLPLYLIVHVALIWLLRSLYFRSGVIPALMDLGLCALGIAAAVWAVSRSGSVFLATWCFFLVQALFPAIPAAIRRRRKPRREPDAGNDGFERARRQADDALRRLFTP